ncbi:MAG: phosphate signaling complex protein PhoU [Phycisphaerales bacterium JB038]
MGAEKERRLLEIRRAIFTMASVVESRLQRAVEALVRRDREAAEDVRHGDRAVDVMEIDVERMCIETLALQHPVAGDLRFILAVLRINGELERIADLSKGIAKRLLRLDLDVLDLPDELGTMALAARDMLTEVLRAFGDSDVERARRVRRDDLEIDRLRTAVRDWGHGHIVEGDLNPESVVDLLDVARCLERIGDMCTNVAEDVVFLVEGRNVRHTEL